MATCARSLKLLRNLDVQLGKLYITNGIRPIHLCAATSHEAVKTNGVTVRTSALHTAPARAASGTSGTRMGLGSVSPSIVVLRETIEINGNEKPKVKYDCPRIPGLDSKIEIPPSENANIAVDIPEQKDKIEESPSSKLPEVKLKQKKRNRRKNQHITIIRSIKMKRHRLLRLRKKLWPITKKKRFLRRKKQEKLFRRYLEKKRDIGRNFDAEKFVRDCLEKAKKAGYKYDHEILAMQVQNVNSVRD